MMEVLHIAPNGNLYDGFQAFGTLNTQIYSVSPSGTGAVFHQFAADLSEGLGVNSRLILGSDGNIYGTMGEGGAAPNFTKLRMKAESQA
jgi:hypothetical protein